MLAGPSTRREVRHPSSTPEPPMYATPTWSLGASPSLSASEEDIGDNRDRAGLAPPPAYGYTAGVSREFSRLPSASLGPSAHSTPAAGVATPSLLSGQWSLQSTRVPLELPPSTAAGKQPQDRLAESTTFYSGVGAGLSLYGVQSFLRGIQDLLSAGSGIASGSPVGMWGAQPPAQRWVVLQNPL